jgi:putative protease
VAANIGALKIEGRMKGIHYAATAVKVYREAIDSYLSDPQDYEVRPYWQDELDKITSRGYCTGFYLGAPEESAQRYATPQPPDFALAAKVLASGGRRRAHIEVRNQLRLNDPVEIVKPLGPPIPDRIRAIMDMDGQPTDVAQPGSRVTVDLAVDCERLDLLRLKIGNMLAFKTAR